MANPCANFFPEMEFNGSGAINVTETGDGSCETPLNVDLDLLISDDPGNTVEERTDGLYAAPEILCYKQSLKVEGNLEVTSYTDCNNWEHIAAGSAVAFVEPYLHKPASGSGVQARIYENTGLVISTLNIAPGQTTGTWSPSTWNVGTSNRKIALIVTAVGSSFAGCGLTAPIQVCEPYSALADPGDFWDNMDPSQLCAMIAANCNSSVQEITPGVYRHTANDGTVTDMPITGFGPGDVSPLADNNITYDLGAYSPKTEVLTFSDNTTGSTAFAGGEVDSAAYNTLLVKDQGTVFTVTNPSTTRNMRLIINQVFNPTFYANTFNGSLYSGPSGAKSGDPSVSHDFTFEVSVNGAPHVVIRRIQLRGRGHTIGTDGGTDVVYTDWRIDDRHYSDLIPATYNLTPGQTFTIGARYTFKRLNVSATPKFLYGYYSPSNTMLVGGTKFTGVGIIV